MPQPSCNCLLSSSASLVFQPVMIPGSCVSCFILKLYPVPPSLYFSCLTPPVHRWWRLPCKVPASTSGAVWGSVSCPRTLLYADQGNQQPPQNNMLAQPLSHSRSHVFLSCFVFVHVASRVLCAFGSSTCFPL